MNDYIIIDNITLKKFDDMYYISQNGDIYSTYSRKFLKHYIDHNGYHRVDIHSKHIKVHKLVYLTWIGPINNGELVLHKDDNKNNNNIQNLYIGNQKQNIHDCQRNCHRVGNIDHLTVYDKQVNQVLTFSPMKEFIPYCGHPNANGSIKKYFNKNWFKKRYIILDYGKGVTTIGDECNLVGQDFVTCSKRTATSIVFFEEDK